MIRFVPFLLNLILIPLDSKDFESVGRDLFVMQANTRITPQVSESLGAVSAENAYRIQKGYVSHKLSVTGALVSGYKAGLTSRGGQAKFGVDGPLAGVLFNQGRVSSHPAPDNSKSGFRLNLNDYTKMMLETELAFVCSRPIRTRVESPHTLKGYFLKVAPAIEVPELGFENLKTLNGSDIIAANVAVKQFMLGPSVNVHSADLNLLEVSLWHGSEKVNHGKGNDASDNQWEALHFLVNKTLDSGYEIQPGQVLLTGALGKMVPARRGSYTADFGPLAKIHFEE